MKIVYIEMSPRTQLQRILDDLAMVLLPLGVAMSSLLTVLALLAIWALSAYVDGVPVIVEPWRALVSQLAPFTPVLFAVFGLVYARWLHHYQARLTAYGVKLRGFIFSTRQPLRAAEAQGTAPHTVPVFDVWWRRR